MSKLGSFNFISLDGYYKDTHEGVIWHQHGDAGSEESQYAKAGAESGSILLFGRVTYEMMAAFWPTAAAHDLFPEVAVAMNKAEKIVFSKTLKNADWHNTRIISDNITDEIGKIKSQSERDMRILGSGSIVTLFAEHGLIDEFQIMIDPIALGGGTSMFKGISQNLDLTLIASRVFKSGVVLLTYQPVST